MKSAYELAMERLEKTSGPSRKLTDEQKARLAEVDKKFEAKMAEVRLSHQERAGRAENLEERELALAAMAEELQRLEERKEAEKGEIWAQDKQA